MAEEWGRLVDGRFEAMPAAEYAAGEAERRARGWRPVTVVAHPEAGPETHYWPAPPTWSEVDGVLVCDPMPVPLPDAVAAARRDSILAPHRLAAQARIDALVRRATEHFVPAWRATAYTEKARQARQVAAGGQPGRTLAEEAEGRGITAADLAAAVLAKADAYDRASGRIERAKVEAEAAVAAAASIAAIAAAVATAEQAFAVITGQG